MNYNYIMKIFKQPNKACINPPCPLFIMLPDDGDSAARFVSSISRTRGLGFFSAPKQNRRPQKYDQSNRLIKVTYEHNYW